MTTNDEQVEALARVLWAATVRGATAGDPLLHEEALNLADAVLASDWLAADRARVWDEGYTSGHSNAMRRMSDEPDAPTTPNPYQRSMAEAGEPDA